MQASLLRVTLLFISILVLHCHVGRSIETCQEIGTFDQPEGSPSVTWRLDDQFQLQDVNLPPRSNSPLINIEARHLKGFRATEWRLSLPPQSTQPPPILSDLSSANLEIVFPSSHPLSLYWNEGSHGLASDFKPYAEELRSSFKKTFDSIGGRSSDGVMPYFHVANGSGGFIFAIGWSGDWRCSISNQSNNADESSRLKITAGLKHQSLRANNKGQLQLPSILVMSYQGDCDVGHNQFRQLMLQHFSPTHHRINELMPVAASVHGMIGFNDTTETNLTATLEHLSSLNLPIDTFWVDAGWSQSGFPAGQGNPKHDESRFPNGFKRIGEQAEQKQLRFLLWFEPERVMRNSQIAKEHPEWLLKPSKTTDEFRYFENDGFYLFNLAKPEARNWMLNQISEQLTDWRVRIYRQDANIAPAFFWHTDVPPEDAAMLEVEYINGLYSFLDDLQKKHPELIIDGCAAGGRRLDFEMLRRSVVLWRSDSCWGDQEYPRNVQAMTMGLSRWLPLHGLGSASSSTESLRSGLGSCGSFAINYNDSNAVLSLRQHLERYLTIRHVFSGDFYPLTKWTLNPDEPLAFQFHGSESETGLIQFFWSEKQKHAPMRLFPKGLQPESNYILEDWNSESSLRVTGEHLMRDGIALPERKNENAIILQYRLVKP